MDEGSQPLVNSKLNNSSLCSSIFSSLCNFSPSFSIDRSDDAVVDSGCTTHTFPAENRLDLKPVPASHATRCLLPNGNSMTQSHTGTIPIFDMPPAAKILKVYAEHAYKPLLSLGQLADAGYKFSGDHQQLILHHPKHKDLFAFRCPNSGMYILNLKCPHNSTQAFNNFSSDCPLQLSNSLQDATVTNNVFSMTTKADLAIYYHRAAWSPVPATFITAIQQGYFATWPGLTAALISKHLPKSINTTKGHMKLQR